MRKCALVWFIAIFIAIFATPALGDNSTAVNESFDKYSPEFRIPAQGESTPTPIEKDYGDSPANYSPEFDLTRVNQDDEEIGVQKGEAWLIQQGLINYSDPRDRERDLEMYAPEHNITADGPPSNEITPIEPIEDTSERYNMTASSVFVGFFENLIESIKFW
ncbi:MAG: hypothetical protein Q7U60_02630 [Candidatus Methanoperedens sp.]|nr:hypothetical protein [Candidatus Methanoperedens sp.]